MCACQSILLLSIAFGNLLPSRTLLKGVFFATYCLVTMCLGGNFSLLPAATARFFGDVNFGKNYACIFIGLGVASVSGAFATKIFYSILHARGIVLVLVITSAIGSISTFTLPNPENFSARHCVRMVPTL